MQEVLEHDSADIVVGVAYLANPGNFKVIVIVIVIFIVILRYCSGSGVLGQSRPPPGN